MLLRGGVREVLSSRLVCVCAHQTSYWACAHQSLIGRVGGSEAHASGDVTACHLLVWHAELCQTCYKRK